VAVNANTKASEERFETLLNNRQRNGWVIFADYLQRTGQSDKRNEIVQEMNHRFPDHVDLQKAYAFLDKNNVDKATQIAEKLVAHDPYQAEFLQLLANVREKQRLFDPAKTLFETALKLQPYRAEIMNEYGQLLMATKDYNAALPLLKEAHSIKPGLTFIAESLALDYIYLKDYDAASALADTLFMGDENSPGAHLIKLTVALNKGEKVKAMIHYAEFVAHGQDRSDYETMKKYYDYLAR
jgi:Tfp pilus assembly protein PilF